MSIGLSRTSARAHTRTKLWATVMSVALVVSSAIGLGPVAVSPASAADSTCGFATAGTGTFANTICWFNLAGYSAGQAATGQPVTIHVPGGYTIAFTLTVTGGAVKPVPFPTYSGAYLGNAGHYSGVPGSPALYQSALKTTTVVTLTNIVATDSAGGQAPAFSLVGADAESTDAGESVSWTSTSPLTSLTQTPTGNGIGNACDGGFTGVNTTHAVCAGATNWITKTGAPILAAPSPSSFSLTMVGAGSEAVALGVLVSRLKLTKQVVGGFAGDSFDVAVDSGDGSVLAHANTNGGATATTGDVTVMVGLDGSDFTFDESATSGLASNYTTSWSCTRNGVPDASLPPGAGPPSTTVTVNVGDAVACVITNTAKPIGITVVKHAGAPDDVNGTGITDAGDTIPYTFTVTNTGQLVLHGVVVTDSKAGAVTCPPGDLEAGDSEECAADAAYVITAADQGAGSADNSATVSGLPPGSTTPVTSATSTTSTPVETPAPSLSLSKAVTVVPPADFTASRGITYSFVVTNTGNVTLTSIHIQETAFSGAGTPPVVSCDQGTTALAPGAQLICTAPYTIAQADVDAGTLTNTAVASGVVGGATRIESAPDTAAIPFAPSPAVAVQKSVSPDTVTASGQVVTYSYQVTNTGDASLSGAAVVEQAADFTGSGPAPQPSCPTGSFVPGETVTCTATYTVTQADVDRGTVANTATASAVGPGAVMVVSGPSTATVTAEQAGALSLVKSATPEGGVAGDTVGFTYRLTNVGNVTLDDLFVRELSFSGSGPYTVSCPPGASLAPSATATCEGTYTLTQRDVDAGSVTNTADVDAVDPLGGTVTSNDDTAGVSTTRVASLTLSKTATPSVVAAVGDQVIYAFHLTNTGTVSLLGPSVRELAFTGTDELSPVACTPGVVIAPAATIICTAAYRVTQADLDAGDVENTAQVTAEPPQGMDDPTSNAATATVTAQTIAALALRKTADAHDITAAGQKLTYTYELTNTGTITLSDARVMETSFSGSGGLTAPDCSPAVATLAPGLSTTCHASYTVTQADVDSRALVNTAVARATAPKATTPTQSAEAQLSIPTVQRPGLSLTKTADTQAVSTAGQAVTYTFTLRNTGNTTLRDAAVTEGEFTGSGDLSALSCASMTVLLPGDQAVCTASYSVVGADLTGSPLSNSAQASAAAPDAGRIRSNISTFTVETLPPGLASTGWTGVALITLSLALMLAGAATSLITERRRTRGTRGTR